MEKQMPFSIEAEEAVLGAILLDPGALSQVADFLRPEHFYRESNRLRYEAMLSLDAAHIAVDMITIDDELERRGVLSQCGGSGALGMLLNASEGTTRNIEYHARVIVEKAQHREMIKLASEIVANAYAGDPLTVTKAEEALYRIGQGRRMSRVSSIKDAVTRYMEKLDLIHERKMRGITSGIATGFKALDQVTGGFQRSDLIVLAGRPGKGKTSLALNIGQQVAGIAATQEAKVLICSLEMGEEQLVRRLISGEAQVDQARMRTGDIEDHEWNPIYSAAERVSKGRLWIDDTPALSLTDMRSRARRIKSEFGLDMIIVDYMQLMKATTDNGKQAENRVQEVSILSRGLKELARELDVPVLALAQLSRAVEQRGNKEPQLSDLRESGSIEQDSDIVMFIDLPEDAPTLSGGARVARLIVAKHRNGPIGIVPLRFIPFLTQFSDLELDEEVAQ